MEQRLAKLFRDQGLFYGLVSSSPCEDQSQKRALQDDMGSTDTLQACDIRDARLPGLYWSRTLSQIPLNLAEAQRYWWSGSVVKCVEQGPSIKHSCNL